jgi:hypothetical protein
MEVGCSGIKSLDTDEELDRLAGVLKVPQHKLVGIDCLLNSGEELIVDVV